jgi:U1 small nuclear ribonucleoprotein
MKKKTNSKPLSTLFVGGLSFNIREKHLYRYFSMFGPIDKVNLLRRKDNGLSKGFAFIFFRRIQDMKRVIQAEDHYILGRKIDC